LPDITFFGKQVDFKFELPATAPSWVTLQDSQIVIAPPKNINVSTYEIKIKVLDILNPTAFSEGKMFITLLASILDEIKNRT
jgi:hypothetical protein